MSSSLAGDAGTEAPLPAWLQWLHDTFRESRRRNELSFFDRGPSSDLAGRQLSADVLKCTRSSDAPMGNWTGREFRWYASEGDGNYRLSHPSGGGACLPIVTPTPRPLRACESSAGKVLVTSSIGTCSLGLSLRLPAADRSSRPHSRVGQIFFRIGSGRHQG